MNWKDFYIKFKWMPTSILVKKFGIKHYDITNFKRVLPSYIKDEFSQWSISLDLPKEQLKKILMEGWEYYLKQEKEINFEEEPSKWISVILELSGTQIREEGFSFLVDPKYLKKAFGEDYQRFIDIGYTSIAFCLYECYPKKEILIQHNILPIMFTQTKSKVLEHTDLPSLLEHIYYNFMANPEDEKLDININERKERYVIRYKERDFISKSTLRKYGLTPHFCKQVGGLNNLLEELAMKYLSDLGLGKHDSSDTNWSAERFRRENSDKEYYKCKYCDLSPIDMHHLLPRNKYAKFIYHSENVVPLCVQVHARITRNTWTEQEKELYEKAILEWHKKQSAEVFDSVMEILHENTYGMRK